MDEGMKATRLLSPQRPLAVAVPALHLPREGKECLYLCLIFFFFQLDLTPRDIKHHPYVALFPVTFKMTSFYQTAHCSSLGFPG